MCIRNQYLPLRGSFTASHRLPILLFNDNNNNDDTACLHSTAHQPRCFLLPALNRSPTAGMSDHWQPSPDLWTPPDDPSPGIRALLAFVERRNQWLSTSISTSASASAEGPISEHPTTDASPPLPPGSPHHHRRRRKTPGGQARYLALFDESLEHRIVPKTLQRPVLNRKQYGDYIAGLLPFFKSYTVSRPPNPTQHVLFYALPYVTNDSFFPFPLTRRSSSLRSVSNGMFGGACMQPARVKITHPVFFNCSCLEDKGFSI